jgi:hypothetical protein
VEGPFALSIDGNEGATTPARGGCINRSGWFVEGSLPSKWRLAFAAQVVELEATAVE